VSLCKLLGFKMEYIQLRSSGGGTVHSDAGTSALRHIHAPCSGIYHVAGPRHHGMARPQIADRGTASDKEGSCE